MRRALRSSVTAVGLRALSFQPRMREYNFLLDDVLGYYDHLKSVGASEDCNRELINSLLEESSKLSTQTLFPLYMSGDDDSCHLNADGTVTTPKGWKDAWNQYVSGGWQGMSYPEQYGGQGLPTSVSLLRTEMMATANWSFMMYPGLTLGAVNTLIAHGNDVQKNLYMQKMIAGEWSGTMCLTEPQCGTDLGQIRTRAEPNGDGTFKITGTKIFISAGDHDFTENICHIVLAKLPNAPGGTKGISLFLVPKFLVKPDGTLETKRNVECAALEKKMGIKGSSTCQMAFEGSIGWQIGGDHEGMRQMFTFMNTARIGTAIQGVAHSELAFQNGLAYALERTSMRSLSGTKEKDKPADRIIFHPSVRHHVLYAKCIAEAGRAFVMDMAKLVDHIRVAEEKGDKVKAKKLDESLGLLTPIAKGCLTEWGLQAAIGCQQVFGGHGYIKGHGMEQIVRDARIATIYEGTTEVQSLDLIGRKVLLSKENHLSKLTAKIGSEVRPLSLQGGPIGSAARSLWMANQKWRMMPTKLKLYAASNKDYVGTASVDFLYYSGYIVVGYYLVRMAAAAQKHVNARNDADGFYQSKIDLCDFYFNRVFPKADAHANIMLSSAKSVMKIKPDQIAFY